MAGRGPLLRALDENEERTETTRLQTFMVSSGMNTQTIIYRRIAWLRDSNKEKGNSETRIS